MSALEVVGVEAVSAHAFGQVGGEQAELAGEHIGPALVEARVALERLGELEMERIRVVFAAVLLDGAQVDEAGSGDTDAKGD